MVIAIDWDGTITRDLLLWSRFIDDATSEGHLVYVITARPEDDVDDIHQWYMARNTEGKKGPVAILATGLLPKGQFVKEVGLAVDVWIDNQPEWITGSFD